MEAEVGGGGLLVKDEKTIMSSPVIASLPQADRCQLNTTVWRVLVSVFVCVIVWQTGEEKKLRELGGDLYFCY